MRNIRRFVFRSSERPPRRYGSVRVRAAFDAGRHVAEDRHHPIIGTDHVLYGLLVTPDTSASRVLQRLGVELGALRDELQWWLEAADFGDSVQRAPRLSPRLRRVLEMGLQEAKQSRREPVGTGHLLVALLRDRSEFGSELLPGSGITVEQLRAEVEHEPPEPR
jgi:ATP-dependent Clp protease ATP-binding subunit ClpC